MNRKKYVIVKYLDQEEVDSGYAKVLYYSNIVTPMFTCRMGLAELFSKKEAKNSLAYASKYASGSELKGKLKICPISD